MSLKACLIPPCIAVFICIAAASSSIAQTKSDLTKEDKIKEIISRTNIVTSMKDGLETNMPTMVDTYKKQNPDITSDQTAELLKVIRKSIIDLEPSLENMYVQIYDNQLSGEQVDALYTFYSTPMGAQLAQKLQDINRAAVRQAGTWGKSIWAPEIKKRLQADDALKGLNLR
jgi:hypothetical protein